MNNKNIIIISFLSVFLIISIFVLFNSKNYKIKVKKKEITEKVNEEVKTIEEEKITTKEENTTSKSNKITEKKVETKNDNKSTNKQTQAKKKTEQKSNGKSTNTKTTPSTPSKPTITYTCPEGYNLNGTKCSITINARHVCPNNTTDYGNINIPQDTYCINMGEGYEVEEGTTCPNGYGIMRIISLGGPDKYECYPLYKKYYVCDDGYILHDTNKCTKTIEATKNN